MLLYDKKSFNSRTNYFVIFYDLFLKITARSDWPTSDGR